MAKTVMIMGGRVRALAAEMRTAMLEFQERMTEKKRLLQEDYPGIQGFALLEGHVRQKLDDYCAEIRGPYDERSYFILGALADEAGVVLDDVHRWHVDITYAEDHDVVFLRPNADHIYAQIAVKGLTNEKVN